MLWQWIGWGFGAWNLVDDTRFLRMGLGGTGLVLD